jgi:dolichyl-phosphooligosaccharide-protein glycotransferase
MSDQSAQPKKRKIAVPNFRLDGVLKFFTEHWAIILVLFIVLLSTQVRLLDYRWPYLRNIDSYNFLRDIQMIVDNGGVFPGTDPLMLAPEGLYKGISTFYPYLGAYSYMLFHIFSPATLLWQFLIWYPALLGSLIAIPTYFLTKKLYDKRAGVIAALLIVFDISIIARTLAGDPDNDGVVLLMPLIIITVFIYLQDYFSKKEHLGISGTIYSVLLGALLSLWVWTWGGYWFVIWIIVGFLAIKLAIRELHKNNKTRAILWILFIPGLVLEIFQSVLELLRTKSSKKALAKISPDALSFVIVMLVMIIIMSFLVGGSFFYSLFSQLSGIANFGDIKSETGTFPNVYVSVAELQSAGGLTDIIKRIGPSFFTTILAIGYLGYSYVKTRKHIEPLALLIIWFVGPMIATLVAVRFTILFATPIAIGTGILFSKIIKMATEEDKKVSD